MTTPTGPVTPPPAVAALAGDAPLRCVWRNEEGGLTFAVGRDGAGGHVKWAPAGSGTDLGAEARRLRWASAYATVPRVLGTGSADDGSWLHTATVPGHSAVHARWRAKPLQAARAVGRGLRLLHDALPVERCPFDWGPTTRYPTLARDSARSVEQVRAALGPPPPVDRLVVCCGDPCVPNTVLAPDGAAAGHVDLGRLGVADRWADLAVASWSTVWNYGPGYEVPLLAAYGVEPDAVRIGWYRALWGSGPADSA